MESRASTGKHRPWFERSPELLAWELRRFDAWRFPYEIDEDAKARGFLILRTEVPFAGEQRSVEVRYPAETPEFPPVVFDEPVLGRHQHPFHGNFCLLGRPEDDWPAASWGAADLIGYQLLELLTDGEAGEATVRANEEPMPEPYSAYYRYDHNAAILIPGNLASPAGQGGSLRVRRFRARQFVLLAMDKDTGDPRLTDFLQLPGSRELTGRWIRLNTPPPAGPNARELLGWLREEHGELFPPPRPPRGKQQGRDSGPDVVAIVFPEEALPDGTPRDGWLVVHRSGSGGTLLHAQVVSEEERSRRIPELSELPKRKVVVIGVGGLGGELAVQLARAGVGRLHLFDHDRFEASNSVRHVLGVEMAGIDKSEGVADACRRANPLSEIAMEPGVHFGSVDPKSPTALERLEAALEDADLVVETTGVNQIETLVSRVAWESDVPAVLCWLTDGAHAGHLVRLVAGRTACGKCFFTRERAGELLQGDADPTAVAFAQGCSHPTTTGASFEHSELVANTTRLCASMLSEGAYPDPGWDHAVMNFRHDPRVAENRRFVAEDLPPTEDCARCRPAAG